MHLFSVDYFDEIVSTTGGHHDQLQFTNHLGGGGYWVEPPLMTTNLSHSAFPVGTKMETALAIIQNGIRAGPLWKYCSAVATYHCPTDLRTKNLKSGKGWAYDSYSKADGMNGGIGGVMMAAGELAHPYKVFSRINDPGMSMMFVEEADPRDLQQRRMVVQHGQRNWLG